MNMEFSPRGEKPENTDATTNILAMLEQENEPVEQDDPFALKF